MSVGQDNIGNGGTAPGGNTDGGEYGSSFHVPVLVDEVVEYLVHDQDGLYVDATLGGGGHAEAILDVLSGKGRLIGIDRDEEANQEARNRLSAALESGRFRTVQGEFGNLDWLLSSRSISRVQGILVDLGVSTHQVGKSARGFSYREEGRLDMRMDQRSGQTARSVVNTWSEEALAEIFFQYGEEGRARRIARAIIEARPLGTTLELAEVIRSVVSGPVEVKVLSRVFQALRIAVNDELEQLEEVLMSGKELLGPGGRMVVISYHSLEDRRVKYYFKYGNFEGEPVRDLYGNLLRPFDPLVRKPIRPSDEEVDRNPRARSARLRVAERLEDEDRQLVQD